MTGNYLGTRLAFAFRIGPAARTHSVMAIHEHARERATTAKRRNPSRKRPQRPRMRYPVPSNTVGSPSKAFAQPPVPTSSCAKDAG
jgi:hypothetical protein